LKGIVIIVSCESDAYPNGFCVKGRSFIEISWSVGSA